jgi:hypothetical protein
MKATLTQSSPVSDRRTKAGRNLVYIKSPFDDIADKFASAHGIWNLPFKSKTWSTICRETNKINAKALKELFPDALSIKFSAKAGCRCGCSPGYIVKQDSYLPGQNHWVTIEASATIQAVFRAGLFSLRRANELAEEIAAHENSLATIN